MKSKIAEMLSWGVAFSPPYFELSLCQSWTMVALPACWPNNVTAVAVCLCLVKFESCLNLSVMTMEFTSSCYLMAVCGACGWIAVISHDTCSWICFSLNRFEGALTLMCDALGVQIYLPYIGFINE